MTWQEEAHEKGRATAQSLCDQVNGAEHHVALGFLDGLCQEHRTLQQGFWRMMFEVVVGYAKRNNEAWMDARNEAAMNVCGKVSEVVQEPNNFLPNV